MELKNLDKIPISKQEILKYVVEKTIEKHNENIISIFVYGSIMTKDFNEKSSDVNIAIVVKNMSIVTLKSLMDIIKKGLKKKINVPLFLTPEYVKKSLDTFPMEFLTMNDTKCILYGDDILETIQINKEDLRKECEYQLKGKILTIRQAFLEQSLNKKNLEIFMKRSLKALMPVFQNVLRLKLKNPPILKEEIIKSLNREFGIKIDAFLSVLNDKRNDGRIGQQSIELFLDDFLIQLEILSEKVDIFICEQ